MGQQFVLDEGEGILLGAAEPVQLVNHYSVHMGLPDLRQHGLKGRPVCIPAGVSPVYISV